MQILKNKRAQYLETLAVIVTPQGLEPWTY